MRPSRSRIPPVAVVLTLALAGGCAATPDPADHLLRASTARVVVAVADAPGLPALVAATESLGLAMVAAADPSENVVVSPASAVVALAMLAEGARGRTAQAFDAALGARGQDRTDAVNALTAGLGEFDGDPASATADTLPGTPLVHLANQAVVDDDAAVDEKYLEALAAGYGAGVLHTDLGEPGAKRLLDEWVRINSGGLVEKSAIEPTASTRLILQNATVFAARWQMPFAAQDVAPAAFTLADGTSVQAEAMSDVRAIEYAEAGGWRMVRLPYDGPFAAEVVLPPRGTDPAALTPAILSPLRAALVSQEVRLRLPTTDIEFAADLREALTGAGLGELYAAPDLTGISPEPLSLAQASQQAVLKVDGEGTVAAAVTELSMEVSAPAGNDDVTEFVADHPYLFSVVHTDTSWPLFTAAVRDPRH